MQYEEQGLVNPKDIHSSSRTAHDRMSSVGLRHAPSSKTHGGITATEIVLKRSISLANLRKLNGGTDEDTLKIRRYILGLSLVAVLGRSDETFNLRQGCLLQETEAPQWRLVSYAYYQEDVPYNETLDSAMEYAQAVSADFGVGSPRTAHFDPARATTAAKTWKNGGE